MANAKKKTSSRPDFASIGGIILAVGGILGGLILDGGKVQDVKQVTAAMIVFGGTIGAVLVTTPLAVVLGAVKKLGSIFMNNAPPVAQTIDSIIGYATQARKQGIVSLEQEAEKIADPFLRKALNLAVDGMELSQIRGIMDLEIELMEQRGEAEAKAFESAGGYSPTIGIIGAVLGLIQVMQHLDKIDEVGKGIAVAFVATLYGVGTANLILLPCAGKLRIRIRNEQIIREMTLEGVVSILEGMNPRMLEAKLLGFLTEAHGPAAVAGESNAEESNL